MKAKEGLSPQVGPLLKHGTWHPVPYLLHSHTLIDVYYPSHAFPRQTNHQQRKPTRPPTTTTAATEMPAIAPVERLGPVLAATHTVESGLGVKPSLHLQMLSSPAWELVGHFATHDFFPRPNF